MMGILLNLCLNIGYKQDGFFKTLPKKGLKFVLNRVDSTIIFNFSFVLLPVEINFVVKKRGRKRDMLMFHSISHV